MDQREERQPLGRRRWQTALQQTPAGEAQLHLIEAELQQGSLAVQASLPAKAQHKGTQGHRIAQPQPIVSPINLESR
jgi:hypothetical protein